MNKAFTKESDVEEDEPEVAAQLPVGSKNYMTQAGYARLKAELDQLLRVDRPDLVKVVSWAASNGDRSENGDYIYGKRRLREMDRRIRFLIKRLESATIVNPAAQENVEQVFFGAVIRVRDGEGSEAEYQIVGVDETDASSGKISWISPLARALLKAREGDIVKVASPGGLREIEILEIRYE